ncbi:hypothetical protein D3C75_1058080 [compost metagenome]
MTNITEERITIAGSAPKFDAEELKQLESERHTEYHKSQQGYIPVFAEFPYDLIIKIIELTSEGYVLSNKYPIVQGELRHHAWMRKPDHLIQADLEVIDAQTKQSYVAWLESEHDRYKQMLTAQLIQTAALKEKKREEEKQAKLLRDIEKEVDATFADLVIPE